MATNSELKPCPFCAGTAELKQCSPHPPHNVLFIPVCKECRIEMKRGKVGIGWFKGADAAIEAWNCRASEMEAHHEE